MLLGVPNTICFSFFFQFHNARGGKLVKIKEGRTYSFSGLKLMNSFKPSINAIVTEAVENNSVT